MSVPEILRGHRTHSHSQQRSSRGSGQQRWGRSTHHGNRLRGDHLLGAEGGEVRQVGQNVHGGDYGEGDDDGARKVPVGEPQDITTSKAPRARAPRASRRYSLEGLDHLLGDEIQIIPVGGDTRSVGVSPGRVGGRARTLRMGGAEPGNAPTELTSHRRRTGRCRAPNRCFRTHIWTP